MRFGFKAHSQLNSSRHTYLEKPTANTRKSKNLTTFSHNINSDSAVDLTFDTADDSIKQTNYLSVNRYPAELFFLHGPLNVYSPSNKT